MCNADVLGSMLKNPALQNGKETPNSAQRLPGPELPTASNDTPALRPKKTHVSRGTAGKAFSVLLAAAQDPGLGPKSQLSQACNFIMAHICGEKYRCHCRLTRPITLQFCASSFCPLLVFDTIVTIVYMCIIVHASSLNDC